MDCVFNREPHLPPAVPVAIRQFLDGVVPAFILSDDLLSACRAGDREAFARPSNFVATAGVRGGNRHRWRSSRRSRRVTGGVHDAADSAAAIDGRAAFSTWLYRIAVHAAVDHQRVRRRSVPWPETLEDGRRVEND